MRSRFLPGSCNKEVEFWSGKRRQSGTLPMHVFRFRYEIGPISIGGAEGEIRRRPCCSSVSRAFQSQSVAETLSTELCNVRP